MRDAAISFAVVPIIHLLSMTYTPLPLWSVKDCALHISLMTCILSAYSPCSQVDAVEDHSYLMVNHSPVSTPAKPLGRFPKEDQ